MAFGAEIGGVAAEGVAAREPWPCRGSLDVEVPIAALTEAVGAGGAVRGLVESRSADAGATCARGPLCPHRQRRLPRPSDCCRSQVTAI